MNIMTKKDDSIRPCFGTKECKVHAPICKRCPWFEDCVKESMKKGLDVIGYTKSYRNKKLRKLEKKKKNGGTS